MRQYNGWWDFVLHIPPTFSTRYLNEKESKVNWRWKSNLAESRFDAPLRVLALNQPLHPM